VHSRERSFSRSAFGVKKESFYRNLYRGSSPGDSFVSAFSDLFSLTTLAKKEGTRPDACHLAPEIRVFFLDASISPLLAENPSSSRKMKLPRVPPTRNSSPGEPQRRLQHIQRQLSQNSLSEFRIGFENDEFRSRKDVESLIHVIEDKYLQRLSLDKFSFLESIQIGWKLPNFALGPVLQQIIPMLLQHPGTVRHLQLTIHSRAPLPTIQRLISWPTLETLDLGSLSIQACAVNTPGRQRRGTNGVCGRGSLSPRHRSASPTSTIKTDSSSDDDGKRLGDYSVLHALPYISSSIKTLKLAGCELTADQMIDTIRILRTKRNLKSLSLRNNRCLVMNGWLDDLLDELPFLKALDVSICDLGPVDGMNLANSLRAHSDCRLERLNIAGNYRLDESIPEIVDACISAGLSEVECSHCDISNEIQESIFELMATRQPCPLRSLKMQGARISSSSGLVRCIEQNKSLERLILNHPRDPFEVSAQNLELFLAAIRNNYYLCSFQIDLPWNYDKKVQKELEHWLTLNRCGRSILVEDPRRNWPTVIAAIDGLRDIDALHWILRRGVEQFCIDRAS
jgi:hypothetical protein